MSCDSAYPKILIEEKGKLDKRREGDKAGSVERHLATPSPEEQKAALEKRSEIEATLEERGNRYGEFDEHARITQNIKRAMVDSRNWDELPDDMKEALEMVAHKAGRILNGDPNYHDSWHDIIGYTKLVADKLNPEGE